MSDRIERDEAGTPDDVIIHDVATLHIERMDTGHIWMGIGKVDGTLYQCEFSTPRNGRLNWLLEEGV
jgi:hypothetical protein